MDMFSNLEKISKKEASPLEVLKTLDSKKPNSEFKSLISFELLDREHPYFNCGQLEIICNSWYNDFFIMIKEFTSMPFKIFYLKHQSGKYETHQINFKNANFDFNKIIGTNEVVQYEESSYQIRLGKSKGRMHGIFISNVFFIIWMDPHHNLLNVKNYEKARELNPYKICSERIKYTDAEYSR